MIKWCSPPHFPYQEIGQHPVTKMVLTYFCCVGNTCLWHFVQNIFADYKIYFVFVTYLFSHDSNGRVRKWVAKRTWAKATLFTIIPVYCWKWHWINRSIKHEKGKTGIWWEKGYSHNWWHDQTWVDATIWKKIYLWIKAVFINWNSMLECYNSTYIPTVTFNRRNNYLFR